MWTNLVRKRNFLWRKLRRFKLGERWIYYLPVLGFSAVVFFVFFTLIAFAWVSKDLPSPDKVVRQEGFATKIYDRTGELLYDVFKEGKRTPVKIEEIPAYLKWATLSIEDKDFYTHSGFSIRGIIRAFFNTIFKGKVQGGSTLTQQLVKNVLLSSERTVSRKFKELILTIQIERKYTKDEILQMYLNEAPYGGTALGVAAAAEQYFNKSVFDLNLTESAILAGLPQRPSAYSPFEGDIWKERTEAVLRRMKEDGYISEDEEKKTVSGLEKVEFSKDEGLMKAPHFVMYVKKLLSERYGEEMVELGGLKVTTSLNLELQTKAEEIVKAALEKTANLNITNGATIALDPKTGQILVLVGSKDYFVDEIEGKFDVITQGLRQPGSAIKPVTYLTAFEKGYNPATLIMDTRTVFPVAGQSDYIPVNYDGKYHGPMQIRYALGNSINVPAVKMLATVGLDQMLTTAHRMGISTLAPTKSNLARLGLSVTLGGGDIKPVELASAYLAFANGGIKREPVAILKIEDRNGKTIFEHKDIAGTQVMSEGNAFLISDILADNGARVLTFGERNGLIVGDKRVSVKTGTTNDRRDNWCVGWTANVLVLAWVGNNDNTPMKSVASGISGATPIWRQLVAEAINKLGYREINVPGDVVSADVDSLSGYLAHDGFTARREYFNKGTEPAAADPIHKKIKVCRSSGKLATPSQIARGDYDEKEFVIFKEEDPYSIDNKNRWQEGVLAWIAENDNEKYHPPGEYCEEGGLVEVAIDQPANQATVGSSFPVKIKVTGINKISEVKVFVNNNEKKVFTSKPYEFDLTLPDGVYVIKVTAKDSEGNTGEREAKVGVNLPADWTPSPTLSPTSIPTPTATLSPTPI